MTCGSVNHDVMDDVTWPCMTLSLVRLWSRQVLRPAAVKSVQTVVCWRLAVKTATSTSMKLLMTAMCSDDTRTACSRSLSSHLTSSQLISSHRHKNGVLKVCAAAAIVSAPFNRQTRCAWQSLACSPPALAAVFENTYFTFFSYLRKHAFLRFFEMT